LKRCFLNIKVDLEVPSKCQIKHFL
jgi:hypothetical protein